MVSKFISVTNLEKLRKCQILFFNFFLILPTYNSFVSYYFERYDPAAMNLLAREFRPEQPAKATQCNNSGEREEVHFTNKETFVIPGQGWAGPGWADTYGCPGVVWAGLGQAPPARLPMPT